MLVSPRRTAPAVHAALSLMIVLAAALSACGEREERPGPTREEMAGLTAPAPVAPAAPASGATGALGRRPPPPTAPPIAALGEAPPPAPARFEEPAPEPAGEGEAPASPAAPARDLSAELRDAMGDIHGCLDADTAARLGGSLRVSVSATALPSGRLQRASVSASGLDASAIACIRGRVEAGSLRGPVDGAPRTVTTSVSYEVRTSAHTEDPAATAP